MTFTQYPKIRTLGHEENKNIFADPEDLIVIQEKMDGSNFRFYKSPEGKIIFGSRSTTLVEQGDHIYQKQFNRCIKYVSEKLYANIDSVPEGYIFYGENMIKHTLDYQWDNIPPFLGFDIYDIKNDCWVSPEWVALKLTTLEIFLVPCVDVVKAADVVVPTDDNVPESRWAAGHKVEGLVYKNYSKGIFAKYVREEFKEKNADVFGGTPKLGEGEEAVFCLRYCTNARIDKQIFKLIDEGNKLDLPLMEYLPRRVWRDIWEEEWEEIISGKVKNIDFAECRRIIARRCLSVLKQIIATQAIQHKEEN